MSSESRLTFFRQSGWMILAVTASGLFMYAVHIPAVAGMHEDEYGVFVTLLQSLNLMLIPGLSLQIVFSQQTAAVRGDEERRQLTGAVQMLLRWTFLLWLAAIGATLFVQNSLIESFKISSSAALWITVGTFLPTLWLPIMQGLLQGNQNFLWLGWTAILAGLGRFLTVLVTVLWLGGTASGGMIGPLVGTLAGLFLGMWHTRSIWTGPAQPFDWRPWVARVIPLTLGLAASQIMFAADMIVVRKFFQSQTGMYGAVGTIARGIVIFTGPVAMVMFPKIVQSVARREATGLLPQALAATGILGGAAALSCTLFPELPFLIMKRSYLPIAPLLPWFAWCMMPLTLSNVLINHLLARSQFKAVPWLLLVALAYVAALVAVARFAHAAEGLQGFKLVVQTLGGFNLLLLGVAAWFTWRTRREAKIP